MPAACLPTSVAIAEEVAHITVCRRGQAGRVIEDAKDECDKLHQTNGNLERKLAQAKMELANAKAQQDDAEVQRDHALIMQQTALQELNLMRRQVVSGPETR